MEMNCDITEEMNNFINAPLENMAMDIGTSCTKNEQTNIHLRPPPSSPDVHPKKKRRINAKGSRATSQKRQTQNLGPPILSGYGDTIVLSNPFDDAPSKTCRNNSTMNIGSNIGQQVSRPCIMNGPVMRNPIPMMQTTNVRGPLMPRNNMANPIRPMMNNQMNNMMNFAPMINQAPRNFPNPMNKMQRNSSNVHDMKIGAKMNQNAIMQTQSLGNPINCNNYTINEATSTNDADELNQLLDQYLPLNNTNNERGKKTMIPNHRGNDMRNVEILMNANMNISQQNQMGMSANDPMAAGLYQEKQNNFMRQPNLQRACSMPRKLTPSEKIYPADQPVIFNYQNPHAPPIYPCGICHKEVNDNDQGIICESGCNFWFHRGCLGLSSAAFQLLTQEIYAEWACDNCLRTKNIPAVKFKP